MIINKQVLGRVYYEAVRRIKTAVSLDLHEQKRWLSAIAKAHAYLSSAEIRMNQDSALIIHGATGRHAATPNHCDCQAFQSGNPCYHRAAARLLELYAQAMQELVLEVPVQRVSREQAEREAAELFV